MIFDFWSKIERGQKVHPADKAVFARLPQNHGFQTTDCLPAAFSGLLRTAPIVLLYLSPGLSDQDKQDALSEDGKNYYFNAWQAEEPLPMHHMPARKWIESRTKGWLGPYQTIRHKVAILNIGAYHSKDVKSYSSLLTLPSSRVSLTWAQEVLFRQAEDGKRLVVCMRAANYWGLTTGRKYGKALFAPEVTRSGHLIRNNQTELLKNTAQNFLA